MDKNRPKKTTPEFKPYPAAETPPESLKSAAPETTSDKKEKELAKMAVAETKPPKEEKKLLSKLPFIRRKKTLPAMPVARDELSIKVEKILAENIREPYEKLSPIARQEFKIKGEETAAEIGGLLRATRIKVKKIFQLILEWLFLLPGVNKFFLEQEAKIKTDRVLALKKRNQQ